ncbi:MAG TPA: DUF4352 domain-containing protein [Herpetosiphonaceae bacterium]
MSYVPPTPAGPSSGSNRTLWIILGSIGFVGVCMVLCTAIGIIGVLTLLGRQTEQVFSEIERELNADTQFELPTTEPVDVGAAVAVGTTQRVGDLDVTVVDVQTTAGDGSQEPTPGYQFLAVRLKITNRGAQPIALEDVALWTWLQDEDDWIYDCCVFTQSDPELLGDALPAGESIEGSLVYEGPDDVDTMYWIYEDLTGNTRAVVRLHQLTADTEVAVVRYHTALDD